MFSNGQRLMRHFYSFLRSISPTRTRLLRPEAVVKHVPGPALAWRRLRPPAAPGRGMAGVRNPLAVHAGAAPFLRTYSDFGPQARSGCSAPPDARQPPLISSVRPSRPTPHLLGPAQPPLDASAGSTAKQWPPASSLRSTPVVLSELDRSTTGVLLAAGAPPWSCQS